MSWEMKFLADSMLGKLAKWLRILGFDTRYQSIYREGEIASFLQSGRTLITRDKKAVVIFTGALFVQSNRVEDQLKEIRKTVGLALDESKWFSLCLLCNIPLVEAIAEEVGENVPDYVFFENPDAIRTCPSCGRFFWPGSHREKMIRQLKDWGF